MPGILSRDQIETFQRDGLLILRDFYAPSQVEPIQRAIYDIIGLVIDKYRLDIERAPFAPERFDDGYQAVIKAKRQYGAEDLDGHHWLFSQHIRDVSPSEWGATLAKS